MGTIYGMPENYALRVIGEIDNSEDYEFNLFVVWADSAGNLYYATDSGCSCPAPFEDFYSLADLTPGTPHQVHEALDDWATAGYRKANPGEVVDLHATIAGM